MEVSTFENKSEELKQDEIIQPSVFKKLLLTIAENTYSENVMHNLHFLLLNKLVKKEIDKVVK